MCLPVQIAFAMSGLATMTNFRPKMFVAQMLPSPMVLMTDIIADEAFLSLRARFMTVMTLASHKLDRVPGMRLPSLVNTLASNIQSTM
jgi:hypothetical protein